MLFANEYEIMEINDSCKAYRVYLLVSKRSSQLHLNYLKSLFIMLVIKSIRSLLLLVFTASGSRASLSTFFLSDNIVGADFYQHFDWEALPDPTHGRV